MNLLILLVLASQTCADAQNAYDNADFQGVAPLAQAALDDDAICALEVWGAAHIGLGENKKAVEKFERILTLDRDHTMVGKSPKVRALFEKTKAAFLAANPPTKEQVLERPPKAQRNPDSLKKEEPEVSLNDKEALVETPEQEALVWPYYAAAASAIVVGAVVGSALLHFNNNKCAYVTPCTFGP